MTSTSFNVGLGSASRNSSKVLKPPGGGSSDIFGTSAHEPEPQRKAKNHHLTSSIFSGEDGQTPARKAGNDSFYNLFGAESQNESRPGTAVKDKFKSNIVLDDVKLDAKKNLTFSEDGCRTDLENETVLMEPEDVNEAETKSPETNGVHRNGTEVDEEKEEPNQATTNGEKAETAVNGSSSASSTASTPASAPAPAPAQSAAASRQRVPPGGFSSGLW